MNSDQHPLQMLLIFASTLGSSALISASPGFDGPGVTVPSIRPPVPPWDLLLAIPVVVDPLASPPTPPPGEPDEFAVPRVLVPRAVGAFPELPAPLGSLPELLSPPTLAGPDGTPLTPWVPAPADPARGDPTALPDPTDGPLAAPLPVEPPADAPPADPPPPPPPLLCPKVETGLRSAARANNFTGKWLCIIASISYQTPGPTMLFRKVDRLAPIPRQVIVTVASDDRLDPWLTWLPPISIRRYWKVPTNAQNSRVEICKSELWNRRIGTPAAVAHPSSLLLTMQPDQSSCPV